MQPTVELLRVLLKRAAESHGVAQRLIANAEDMEAIAGGQDAPALSGWRRQVFGADAERLVQGKLAMAVSGGKVRIFPIEDSDAGSDQAAAD